MLFLCPDFLAVHSITSGEALWRTRIEEKELQEQLNFHGTDVDTSTLFLTDNFAGFATHIYETIIEDDDDVGTYEENFQYVLLHFYDPNNGVLIKTEKIFEQTDPIERQPIIFARGSILCYLNYNCGDYEDYDNEDDEVYVFRLVGKELQKHVLQFPLDHFVRIKQLDVPNDGTRIRLLGFLGKTNILIGYMNPSKLKNSDTHVLFSLDLDAVLAAKNEEETNLAFTIHKVCKYKSARKYYKYEHDYFQPVYKTDRTTNSVDLVGAMWKKDAGDGSQNMVIESNIFVTEMECSRDF